MPTLVADLKKFYKAHKRSHLPWRKTKDPYKILVSELMLQQTQVERVVPFYNRFIKKFPTARALASAPLSDVLRMWNGLGYNRRAQYLHQGAKLLAKKSSGRRLRGSTRLFSPEDFASLPGVGPYTHSAILAFAYNKPTVFVETNIRTVFFHHLGARRTALSDGISDSELLPLIKKALKQSKMPPREFYAALMDYGAYLKKSGLRLNSKSAHYTKQSTFQGSARELRGAILRELLHHHASLSMLTHKIPRSREEVARELARLTAEGLVALHGRFFSLPD